MKTTLAIVCGLSVLGALLSASGKFELMLACLGAALVSGTGYAILDRLDTIGDAAENAAAIRKLLEEIRDKDKPRDPTIDDPSREVDVRRAVEAMNLARNA